MLAPTEQYFAEPPCPYCGVPIPRMIRNHPRVTCGAPECVKRHTYARFHIADKKRREAARSAGLCTRCRRRRARPIESAALNRKPLRCYSCARKDEAYRVKSERVVAQRTQAECKVLQIAEVAIAAKRVFVERAPEKVEI